MVNYKQGAACFSGMKADVTVSAARFDNLHMRATGQLQPNEPHTGTGSLNPRIHPQI